ncbi:MAG: hypothetical protein QFF03_11500 [Pseudomonadota bacterium]|nr:hypothetical protein [Pseudomonadota bacterium]
MYRKKIIVSINATGDAIEYHAPHADCEQYIGRDPFNADTTYEDLMAVVGRTMLLFLGGQNEELAERYPCLRVPPRPVRDTSLMTPQELDMHRKMEQLSKDMDQEIADWEKRLDAEDD